MWCTCFWCYNKYRHHCRRRLFGLFPTARDHRFGARVQFRCEHIGVETPEAAGNVGIDLKDLIGTRLGEPINHRLKLLFGGTHRHRPHTKRRLIRGWDIGETRASLRNLVAVFGEHKRIIGIHHK